ncbi:MAG: glycoside hydrolase family 125 protein [Chthoniobacteraceae bacterium]
MIEGVIRRQSRCILIDPYANAFYKDPAKVSPWIKDRTLMLPGVHEREIDACIAMLKRTHAGTGFMHESFRCDEPARFTRKWFAWPNNLFGELILRRFAKR